MLTLLAMWQANNPSEQRSWLEAHLQEWPEHAPLVAQFVERLKRDKKPADLVSDAILREASETDRMSGRGLSVQPT